MTTRRWRAFQRGVARDAFSSPCILSLHGNPISPVARHLFALSHVGDPAGRSFFLFRLQHVARYACYFVVFPCNYSNCLPLCAVASSTRSAYNLQQRDKP